MASADIKIGLEDEARELLNLLRLRPQILRVGEKDTLVICCDERLSPDAYNRAVEDTKRVTGIQNVLLLDHGMRPHILVKEPG